MTDLREAFRELADAEPDATRIDPYAAVTASRARSRTARHRWLAGITAAVIVGGVGLAVALPRRGLTSTSTPITSSSPPAGLSWVSTAPTAGSSFELDVPRTLANLAGVSEEIQRQLGLSAVAPAEPYGFDTDLGVLQLAYRTADGTEVHVVLAGSRTASAARVCTSSSDAAPPLPQAWPNLTPNERPRGSEPCATTATVATTWAAGDRLDHTVAQDVEPLYRGVVSVTVTSDANAPAPTTVAVVAEVVDSLRAAVAFSAGAKPVHLTWVRTKPTAASGRGLDIPRTLAHLTGAIDQIQDLLGLRAVAAAEPYEIPGDLGALQLVYRAAGDVEVQVLLQGPLDEPTEEHEPCSYPPATEWLSDWPTEVSGKRVPAPDPDPCTEAVRTTMTDAGQGRVARTVAGWGDGAGHLSVTITSDASAPAPATHDAAVDVYDLLNPVLFGIGSPDITPAALVVPGKLAGEVTRATLPDHGTSPAAHLKAGVDYSIRVACAADDQGELLTYRAVSLDTGEQLLGGTEPCNGEEALAGAFNYRFGDQHRIRLEIIGPFDARAYAILVPVS